MTAVAIENSVLRIGQVFGSSATVRARQPLVSRKTYTSTEATSVLITRIPKSFGYQTRMPMAITVEQRDGDFVASFDAADIHMSGDDLRDSIDALFNLLIDLYEAFQRDEGNLGKEPARQLEILRSYLIPA